MRMKFVLIAVVTLVVTTAKLSTATVIYPWGQQQTDVSEPVKYVVTFPTIIPRSSPFIFNLVLFNNENYTLPVSFVAKLTSGYDRETQVLAQQSFTQTTYGLQQHSFDNIRNIGVSDDSGLQVSIDFTTGGLENYTDISSYEGQLTEKYVFIQTDKAMYKPSQTVNFRAAALDRQLMPINGLVSVTVEDPKGNQIKVWNSQSLDRGVFGASFVLSDYVNFGDWKITYTGPTIPTTDKTFTVQQYVLPKYEVKLDFPPVNYWLYSTDESKYQGFIRAKYTYGKSVKGKAVVYLTSSGGCNYRYDSPYYSYGSQPLPKYQVLEIVVPLAGDGSTNDGKFVLSGLNNIVAAPDSSYYPRTDSSTGMLSPSCSLYLQVNVTEELTGEVMKSDGSVWLYRDPFNIKVHDSVQKTMKPGLPFTMRMQVTKPDDTPADAGIEVSLQVFYLTKNDSSRGGVSCYSYGRYSSSSQEQQRPANISTTLITDSNGFVSLDVVPPKTLDSAIFNASLKNYPNVNYCDNRSPPQSLSKQSVSMSIDRPMSMSSSIPKVGDTLTFKVQASYAVPYIYFILSQNGQPMMYRQIDTPISKSDNGTVFSISVILPQQAAPRVAAAVWTVEDTANEVLADAIEFKVDGLVRQTVTASFSPSTVKPGGQTSLSIKTSESNSLVALLAVDKSVKLLKSGNDITLDDVVGTVGGGSSGTVSPVLWRCWRCGWWPWWIDSSNAESVFSGISMAIKSNARTRSRRRMLHFAHHNRFAIIESARGVEDDAEPVARLSEGARSSVLGAPLENNRFYPMVLEDMAVPAMAMAGRPVLAAASSNNFGSKSRGGESASPSVRKQFPELWIWREGQIDNSGAFSQSLTAPDTITTWVLSAFAVGSQNGFGALDSPAELTVFQNFFVLLDVPYATVIRNEQFEIKAVVFNYQNSSLSVDLLLQASPDFDVSSDGGQTYASVAFSKTVKVTANGGTSVSVWIKPKRLGDIKMQLVGASSDDPSSRDALEKVVTVEAEGDIRYANRPIFIRFDQQASSSYSIQVDNLFGTIPQNMVVSGSRMFQLQAIGDILGPALTQLGAQIRLPTGCGEQTMVVLAPNVYIYKYLKSVNSLTPDLETKTTRFVESGYQRELTYQRADGGFSAFGQSDSASSTWLTAFVMRSFNAAVKYVNTQIDKTIFEKSWNFLKNSAKTDGTFTEAGKVLHHSMKGGATSDVNLAAYIYVAYAEAGGSDLYRWSSLSETRNRLTAVVKDSKDPYQLALIAYATSILPNDISVSKTILSRLMSMATLDSDLMYWKPSGDQSGIDEYSRSGPSQIEASAYVLLTLVNHNMIENATMVARWLMSQRNSLGGFSSTQDTVVGLQALAEFASKLSIGQVKLDISATYNFADGNSSLTSTFQIDSSNSKLLQSFDLPRERQSLTRVDLVVNGVGVGLVQLALKYNIQTPKFMDSGDYKIIIIEDVIARRKRDTASGSTDQQNAVVSIKTCVQPVSSRSRVGMVVAELGIPTGFTADLEATKTANSLSTGDGSYDGGMAGVAFAGSNPTGVTPSSPLKRIEVGDRKLVYYFDALEAQQCVLAKMSLTSAVMNVQPPIVKAYSYYQPDLVNSMPYSFQEMNPGANSQAVIRQNSAGVLPTSLATVVSGLVALAIMLVVV